MVNGVTSDISTDKDNPAKVTIPYDSNSIVMYGVPADNGSVSYQYDPSNGGFINSGETVAVTVTVTADNGSATQKYYVSVTRPIQTGIGIGGTEEPFSVSAAPATAAMSWKARGAITFTLSGTNPENIQWYVNGTELTGSAVTEDGRKLTLQARDYLVTTYRLTVTAEQDGTQYSRELTFTVTE
jgi:membrane carboxypeptidase/penicillin-binding protein PbpC